MAEQSKKLLKAILNFMHQNYLIVFFILTIGTKLSILNAVVIKLGHPLGDYFYGTIFSYLGAAILLSPLYFIKKHKNKFVILSAFLISLLLLIDTVYFSYFASLPSVSLLAAAGQANDVGPAIANLLNWWLSLYFIDIILVIVFAKPIKRFFSKSKIKHNFQEIGRILPFIVTIGTISLLAIACLSVSISKIGSFFNSGYDMPSVAHDIGVLGAHTIDIARFIDQETSHISDQQKKTITDWVKSHKPAQTSNDMTGIAKGKNVIMVQVESLGAFVINQKINGKEITPNLNQLALTSNFFPNDRFEIGSGHTSDTDLVSNTSMFPLADSATFVRYGKDDFSSLPKTLVNNGYSAFAYHGYYRDFWNRRVALASLGYQKFYAADNYPKGTLINMGLNDGDFLSKTAEYIKDQPKPSLSYAITLSSHTPFEITDQTKNLGLNPRDYPDQVGGYLEDINYTDQMLGNFFAKLKSEGLYDDSLIVVYGDHTPWLSSFTAGTINYDKTTDQQKEVPLFIKLPNETTGKTYPNKGTHLDITPTILDLLGIKTNQLMFGQSLFTNESQSLTTCADQMQTFNSQGSCSDMLNEEKSMSAQIIRYNLFDILAK